MVYLTGDTHGDIQRFKQGKLRWLGKKDTVVVLGDFGFVWDGSAAERKRLDWLRKRPYTILFLDGSHENYDLLAQYPETELFGGRVQQGRDNTAFHDSLDPFLHSVRESCDARSY